MEGLKTRFFVLAGILCVVGGLFWAFREKAESHVTEEWMKDHTPTQIGNFRFQQGTEDPKVTYRADQSVYDTLMPFGIVCRKFNDIAQQFDVTIISGDNRGSFHDPHVCFQAQGWTFLNEATIEFDTKTRGKIPATLATIENKGNRTIALYFYRGPKGFYPSTPNLSRAMVIGPLLGDFRSEAVFYRFMPEYEGATPDEVIAFAAKYMDEAGQMSNGFF
jgi:hypothetical protein